MKGSLQGQTSGAEAMMQRLRTVRGLAIANLLALASCVPRAAAPTVKAPLHGAAGGTAAPAPAAPAPAAAVPTHTFAPGSLHAVAQKPLVRAPDVWDPTGALVGQLATCEMWETATGLYRGALAPAACAAWKRQETQTAQGSLEADETQLWLVHGARVLLDDGCRTSCAPWLAWSLRRDGRRAAGLRRGSDQVVVWDAGELRVLNRWQLEQPLASRARLAWSDDQLVAVGQTRSLDWVGAQFGGREVTLLTDTDGVPSTSLDLDPFGHWLFRQGFGGARDGVGPPIRSVDGITSDSPALVWEFEGKRKDAPPVLSTDGTACAFATSADAEDRGKTKDVRVLFLSGPGPEVWSLPGLAATSVLGFAPDASAVSIVEDFGVGATRVRVLRRDSGGKDDWATTLSAGALVGVVPSQDGRFVAVRFADHLEVRDADGKPLLFWTGIAAMGWQGRDELVVRRDDGTFAARDVRARNAVPPVPARLSPASGGPLRAGFRCEAPGILRRVADGAALHVEGGAVRTDAWVYDDAYAAPAVALREGSDPTAGPFVDASVTSAVLGRSGVLGDFVSGKAIPVPAAMAKEP